MSREVAHMYNFSDLHIGLAGMRMNYLIGGSPECGYSGKQILWLILERSQPGVGACRGRRGEGDVKSECLHVPLAASRALGGLWHALRLGFSRWEALWPTG